MLCTKCRIIFKKYGEDTQVDIDFDHDTPSDVSSRRQSARRARFFYAQPFPGNPGGLCTYVSAVSKKYKREQHGCGQSSTINLRRIRVVVFRGRVINLGGVFAEHPVEAPFLGDVLVVSRPTDFFRLRHPRRLMTSTGGKVSCRRSTKSPNRTRVTRCLCSNRSKKGSATLSKSPFRTMAPRLRTSNR